MQKVSFQISYDLYASKEGSRWVLWVGGCVGGLIGGSAIPVEKGTEGAASKVSTHTLIAVDEETCVHRRSLLSSNVERANTLAAKEVIPLGSPLAVSTKSSVESRPC